MVTSMATCTIRSIRIAAFIDNILAHGPPSVTTFLSGIPLGNTPHDRLLGVAVLARPRTQPQKELERYRIAPVCRIQRRRLRIKSYIRAQPQLPPSILHDVPLA